jgi:hypothetical protein
MHRRRERLLYINIHARFVDGFLLKYSYMEEAPSIDEIRHPIIRESLREVGIEARNLEITSMADIPAVSSALAAERDAIRAGATRSPEKPPNGA